MTKRTTIFFIVSLILQTANGQTTKIDSLKLIIEKNKNEFKKVDTYNSLFLEFEFLDQQLAKKYLNVALKQSKNINYKKGEAKTLHHFGFYFEDIGDYSKAMDCFKASLKIRKIINDTNGVSASLSNIGNIYYYQGNYPEALRNYLAALKIRESLDEKKLVADSYMSIGNIYYLQKNLGEALRYFHLCLKLKISINDVKGIASSYNNIAIVYNEQRKYDDAIKNQLQSLKLMKIVGDKNNIADSYNNIGVIYYAQAKLEKLNSINYNNKLNKALDCYFSSLKISEEINDKPGIASTSINIANLYKVQKKFNQASKYVNHAKLLSLEMGHKRFIMDSYRALADLDSMRHNYKDAFENLKMQILYRDSLDNEESRKQTIQTQMTYEFDKKEAIAEAEHKKELENQKIIANEKSRKQKVIIWFVVCGLVLVVTFAGFIFRSLRKTRKQKIIIEQQKILVEQQKHEVELQKDLVEEKQKEVMDSIRYAKRIQMALLPSNSSIERILKRNNKA